jgi:hypothetical protein
VCKDLSTVDRQARSAANARPIKREGSTVMDLQQDQSYTQIVTGFVIAISVVLGLIIVSVFF